MNDQAVEGEVRITTVAIGSFSHIQVLGVQKGLPWMMAREAVMVGIRGEDIPTEIVGTRVDKADAAAVAPVTGAVNMVKDEGIGSFDNMFVALFL